MSHLPLGGGSDERSEDTADCCLSCGNPVPRLALDAKWLFGQGCCCDEDCFNDYVLASQRAMDREAVQG